MPASRRVLPLLALALTLAVSGCTGLRGSGDLDYVPGEGNVVQVAIEAREGPIEISGTSLQGEPVDLADFRGEVTVVNMWGSWCAPCRSEAPLLVQAVEELDAVFVGINVRDTEGNALAFEREYGVPYPSIYDQGSETLLLFGSRYAPRSMPTTAVLDRDGRVAALISGPIPSEITLTELVEEIGAEDG